MSPKIDWNNIDVQEFEHELATFIFKFEDKEYECSFLKFSYKLITTEIDSKKWYRIEGTLPYNFKSQWRSTVDKNWKGYALNVLNANLTSKYKNILLRSSNYYTLLGKTEVRKEDLHKVYNKPFYHKLNNKAIGRIYEASENGVYATTYSSDMKERDNKLTWDYFVEMMIESNCYYCGISMFQINELRNRDQIITKRFRGYSMEIDQRDPYDHYTDENCVPSCYWCNNAKTDEFTDDEFKNCISKGIRQKWNSRLKRVGLQEITD